MEAKAGTRGMLKWKPKQAPGDTEVEAKVGTQRMMKWKPNTTTGGR